MLLLHRTLPTEAVLAGIDAAVAAGRCDPDLVAVEVPVDTWTVDGPPRWVPDVPGGRLGVDDRPVPLDGYDDLLQPRA